MLSAQELEEKLEKDNLTLKEHILKLQSTIKQIKSDLIPNDNNNNNNNIKGNKKNKYNTEEEHHLKFSFNGVKQQNESEVNNCITETIDTTKNKYKDNFEKLKESNKHLRKTESFKNSADIDTKISLNNNYQPEIVKFKQLNDYLEKSDDLDNDNQFKSSSNYPIFDNSKYIFI